MAGVFVEYLIGIIFLFINRIFRLSKLAELILISMTILLIVHTSFYIVYCFYYECGDGSLVSTWFKEPVINAIIIFVILLTLVLAFFLSFIYSKYIFAWFTGLSRIKTLFFLSTSNAHSSQWDLRAQTSHKPL